MLRQLNPGDSLASYKLERRLGEGAFAEVWLAKEEGAFGFRKQVALKVLKEERATDEHFRSLVNEARVCGHLHHPHVVDVYGVAESDGLRYIAMEYVDGVPMDRLLAICREHSLALPVSVILDVGAQIAQGLHHAHTARDDSGQPLDLVHRDLKPANVLLARRGGAKVTDFGIAKVSTAVTETATGLLKGTPCYVAPEVWKGSREFLPRVDLFALGAMLWEMAVGRRLMDGEGIPALVGQALHGDADAEAGVLAERFPELVPIVRGMIERDPVARVQSALEVEQSLREVARTAPPAPGELELFLDLFHAATGGTAPEHLSLPETDDPTWTRLLQMARAGSRDRVVVASRPAGEQCGLEETAALPSDGAPVAASRTDHIEDAVEVPSSGTATAAATDELGPTRLVARPAPPVPPPQPTEEPPPARPPTGTESVAVPLSEAFERPPGRRWPLLVLGGIGLGALALVVVLLVVGPGGGEPEAESRPDPTPLQTPAEQLAERGEALPGPTISPVAQASPEPRTTPAAVRPTPARAAVPARTPGPTPEPTPAPTPAPTPEPTSAPTPRVVAATTPGCIVFQSTPTGADVCIGGQASGLRARGGTSSRREYPDGSLRVGMGFGGACEAETTVQVRAGAVFFVRCDVAAKMSCTVRVQDGAGCGSL